jgi:hypothetical protein
MPSGSTSGQPHGFDEAMLEGRCTLGHGAGNRGNRAMSKLVEMFAAVVLLVMMLAIIAIATGFLPSRTG